MAKPNIARRDRNDRLAVAVRERDVRVVSGGTDVEVVWFWQHADGGEWRLYGLDRYPASFCGLEAIMLPDSLRKGG